MDKKGQQSAQNEDDEESNNFFIPESAHKNRDRGRKLVLRRIQTKQIHQP